MRKLITLASILSFSIIFYSCGSDKPDDLPVSLTANAEKSFNIIATAGSEASQTVTFTLDDFAAIKDYKKYVESGEIQTNSFIEVRGVTGAIELVNVKLSMNREPKKNFDLQNITQNGKFQGINELKFLENIINELSSRGTSTVKLEYKANTNITTPVELALYLNSHFSFN